MTARELSAMSARHQPNADRTVGYALLFAAVAIVAVLVQELTK